MDAQGINAKCRLAVHVHNINKIHDNPVQQVESFPLGLTTWHTDVHLQAKGAATFVVAAGNHLRVYTLKGALLATFEDHAEPIASFCVVSCVYIVLILWLDMHSRFFSLFWNCDTGQFSRGYGIPWSLPESAHLEEGTRCCSVSREPIPSAGRVSHQGLVWNNGV